MRKKLPTFNFQLSTHDSRGFTFVELIVVIAIFGILSSVVLFNYGNFNSAITLQNLAHDIALQIDQAQKTAISGQNNVLLPSFSSSPGPGGFSPRYGVYFENPGSSVNIDDPSKQFIYFTDLPDHYNGAYDKGNTCTSKSNTESKIQLAACRI